MTIKKGYIKSAKQIGISSMIALSFMGLNSQSCVNANEENADYEVSETYAKGVKTYLKETAPGEFKITDEIEVPADSSQSVITYLDGRVETLSKEKSKEIIDEEIRSNRHGSGFGLGSALLYGGMGYFLARTMSPGYRSYRQDIPNNNSPASSTSSSYNASRSKYYSNDAAFQKSSRVNQSISNSRTVSSRPSRSRSGFFGGSSRGGGFGG